MDLALAIIFLWMGAACLVIAFHPLNLESGATGPSAVIKSIQADVSKSKETAGQTVS